MNNNMPDVVIYTDGSARNNRMGGWSCLLSCNNQWQMLCGDCFDTTNNRMELTAVINGLAYLTVPCKVTIVSDSSLIVGTINLWIHRWVRNKYRNKDGKPIANQDLICILEQLMRKHNVAATWVKAHTEKKDYLSRGNQCCDWFAQFSSSI